MTLLAIPFGLAIGLVVGTVGGGGAILALPVVYILDEPVNPASTASLIVVALAAAVGAGAQARDHHVCLRLAITFSIPAAAAFVPIMALAGVATWQRACPRISAGPLTCLLAIVPSSEPATSSFGVDRRTGEVLPNGVRVPRRHPHGLLRGRGRLRHRPRSR